MVDTTPFIPAGTMAPAKPKKTVGLFGSSNMATKILAHLANVRDWKEVRLKASSNSDMVCIFSKSNGMIGSFK